FSFLPHARSPISPLFPYTTLFRSLLDDAILDVVDRGTVRGVKGRAPPRPFPCRVLEDAGDAEDVSQIDHPRHEQQKERERDPHRSEEHTSELQSRFDLVCRLLLEK